MNTTPYTFSQNAALLIVRIVTAAIFYVAGWFKLPFWTSPPQGISSFMLFTTKLLSIAEPLGATALLIGFMTRTASVCLCIVMVGAILVSHFQYGIGFVTPTGAGWNFPLEILAACLLLVAFGPGKWAVRD
ncbi:MAG TPA: DoxX family protein [Chitinophagaceae bacterium]|jgi:uncharacterized membrane protein YphA (DoxX/SURF4 family)